MYCLSSIARANASSSVHRSAGASNVLPAYAAAAQLLQHWRGCTDGTRCSILGSSSSTCGASSTCFRARLCLPAAAGCRAADAVKDGRVQQYCAQQGIERGGTATSDTAGGGVDTLAVPAAAHLAGCARRQQQQQWNTGIYDSAEIKRSSNQQQRPAGPGAAGSAPGSVDGGAAAVAGVCSSVDPAGVHACAAGPGAGAAVLGGPDGADAACTGLVGGPQQGASGETGLLAGHLVQPAVACVVCTCLCNLLVTSPAGQQRLHRNIFVCMAVLAMGNRNYSIACNWLGCYSGLC